MKKLTTLLIWGAIGAITVIAGRSIHRAVTTRPEVTLPAPAETVAGDRTDVAPPAPVPAPPPDTQVANEPPAPQPPAAVAPPPAAPDVVAPPPAAGPEPTPVAIRRLERLADADPGQPASRALISAAPQAPEVAAARRARQDAILERQLGLVDSLME